jgi:hypothetical protein
MVLLIVVAAVVVVAVLLVLYQELVEMVVQVFAFLEYQLAFIAVQQLALQQ